MKEGDKDGGGGHCFGVHAPPPSSGGPSKQLLRVEMALCWAAAVVVVIRVTWLRVSSKALSAFFLSVHTVGLPVARGLPRTPLARPTSVCARKRSKPLWDTTWPNVTNRAQRSLTRKQCSALVQQDILGWRRKLNEA